MPLKPSQQVETQTEVMPTLDAEIQTEPVAILNEHASAAEFASMIDECGLSESLQR